MQSKRVFLITGPPGIGKTTLIRRVAERIADLKPAGFYTTEIRDSRGRRGFRLVSLSGEEADFSRVDWKSLHRVGRYGVDIAAFESFLSRLNLSGSLPPVILIDEIGKMECLSARFTGEVESLLSSEKILLAVVAQKGGGFPARVRGRRDAVLWQVSRSNRDLLPMEIAAAVNTAVASS